MLILSGKSAENDLKEGADSTEFQMVNLLNFSGISDGKSTEIQYIFSIFSVTFQTFFIIYSVCCTY